MPPAPLVKRRYYGNVEIDKLRFFRDIEAVETEVFQHLVNLPNANVQITIQINAELPDGFSTDLMQIISEKSRTLGFRNSEF